MDKSGHGNNPTERGALTNWRAQTDRQVRTQKQSNRARGTHFLESADGRTSQDTETIRPSEGHSPPGERRGTDKSGHGNNPTERGALTSWRAQTDGKVRTRKESDRARGTHQLESADRWTSQDTERIRPSKGHSQTGERRQPDKSGHGRIRPSEEHSRTGECRWMDKSGHRKNPTERGALSPTGECRRSDKSGYGKNLTEQGALTNWRAQTDRQVRTRKESDRVRGTHKLESADGQTSQDIE